MAMFGVLKDSKTAEQNLSIISVAEDLMGMGDSGDWEKEAGVTKKKKKGWGWQWFWVNVIWWTAPGVGAPGKERCSFGRPGCWLAGFLGWSLSWSLEGGAGCLCQGEARALTTLGKDTVTFWICEYFGTGRLQEVVGEEGLNYRWFPVPQEGV